MRIVVGMFWYVLLAMAGNALMHEVLLHYHLEVSRVCAVALQLFLGFLIAATAMFRERR